MTEAVLIVAKGVLGVASGTPNGDDIWSCGLWFRDTVNGAHAITQAHLDAVTVAAASPWSGIVSSATYGCQSNVELTEIRGYAYTDGVPSARIISYNPLTNPTAGGMPVKWPHQVATVVSLEAAGRVKPKYGRFYLPPQGFDVQADGRFSEARATGVAQEVANMLGVIRASLNTNSDSGAAWQPVIHTRTAGRTDQVVHTVRVGTVPDTHRSRRNKLAEDYQDVVVSGT